MLLYTFPNDGLKTDCGWVGVVFLYPVGSVQASHFTDVTDAVSMVPVLFWVVLNHPL